MKPTVKQFEKLILEEQSNHNGRQSKASTFGFAAERVAVELFKTHPKVESVQQQVRDPRVDKFSKIDLVLNLKCGKKVYVPMAKDLWVGTHQQDRLQLQLYKLVYGKVNEKYNYCYLCVEDYEERLLVTHRKNAYRAPLVKKTIRLLVHDKMLFNIETLWDHLNTL